MAKFLFAAWPFPGDLFPNFAVARVLSARGHVVAFYTGELARDMVREQGYEHFPFDSTLEHLAASLVLAPDGMSAPPHNPWRFEAELRAFFLESMPLQVSDLDVILERWKPDAIVCDPAVWGPIVILQEARHVPMALLSTYAFCFLPGRDVPTPGAAVPRGHTWHARVRARAGAIAADLLLFRTRRAVNRLRREYGLRPLSRPIVESMARLPLYLVPSCREFDYQRYDLPPTVHYIGPCLWYPPEERLAPQEEPSRDRRWVHVTEGTLHWQKPVVLTAAAQGLGGLPFDVVLSTGRRDPKTLGLGALASNIHARPWVPHSSLAPHCAAVVTTGGAGTIMAALTAGVPLVVVPTNWDKPENALRVVEAGAGLLLTPRRCSPARLRKAVEAVINTPSFRENAQRLGACLRRCGGPVEAADLLERLVAGAGMATPTTP